MPKKFKQPVGFPESEPCYFCDPELNIKCPKQSCFIHNGPCRRTYNADCRISKLKQEAKYPTAQMPG